MELHPPRQLIRYGLALLALTMVVLLYFVARPIGVRGSALVPATNGQPASGAGIILSVHALTGEPIAGASVSVSPLSLSGQTDMNGELRIANLSVRRPTRLEVRIEAAGYRTWLIRNAVLYANVTLLIDAPLSVAKPGRDTPEIIEAPANRAESGASPAAPSGQPAPGLPGGPDTTLPSTIRVKRVSLNRIDTVDFNFYVKHVLPNEWIPNWPSESLRSGAMAAKSYGWFATIHAKYPWQGYDVRDTTDDQVYNPNVSYTSTDNAVDDTWGYQMSTNGEIVDAHYCAGAYNGSRTSGQCSETYGWTPGTYMSQWGSKYWADSGQNWQWILSFYYDNLVISPIAPPGTATPTATPGGCAISFSDVQPADYFYTPVLYLACHGVVSGYDDGTFRPYADTTRSQMTKIVVLGFNKAITTPSGANFSFTDVPPTDPFFSMVETAYVDGIVSGYTCGISPAGPCDAQLRPYFLPYDNVTRGQLSKIDVIAAGWTLYDPVVPTFTDVAPGSTFYTVIETAVCHGVISGYADHTFMPFNDATRGQIAKIVNLSIVNPSVSCGP